MKLTLFSYLSFLLRGGFIHFLVQVLSPFSLGQNAAFGFHRFPSTKAARCSFPLPTTQSVKLCRFRQLERAANNERLRNDCEFNLISLHPDPKRSRPSLRKRRRFNLWVLHSWKASNS